MNHFPNSQPVLYSHYKDVPWDKSRWPNFNPDEPNLYCPLSGAFYFDEYAFDCLQRARSEVGVPFRINSGHRSPIYNAIVKGAPLSEHKKIAFDVSIVNHEDHLKLLNALQEAGFTGIGLYLTFIHADMGPKRMWVSKLGEKKWSSLPVS